MAYKNPEHQKEYNRTYYKKNQDSYRAERKQYYHDNRTKILEDATRYYQRNRDDIRSSQNAWAKTESGRNSDLVRKARRRSRKLNAKGSFTAEDIKNLYATQGGRCYYCSVEIDGGYHIEHMTPLSRGGRNDVSNICLACAPCNLRKHTKTAEEFLNEQEIRSTRAVQRDDCQEAG